MKDISDIFQINSRVIRRVTGMAKVAAGDLLMLAGLALPTIPACVLPLINPEKYVGAVQALAIPGAVAGGYLAVRGEMLRVSGYRQYDANLKPGKPLQYHSGWVFGPYEPKFEFTL